MVVLAKNPDYCIKNAVVSELSDAMEPRIEKAVRLEIMDSDVRCMKGDCCKDCPGNYYGG